MIRLFVALALPDAIRTELSFLSGALRGARWIDPVSYHLTLRFIGDIDERAAEEIDLALARVRAPAFELSLQGVGQFGDNAAHALWAGVAASEPLLHLAAKVDSALRRAGQPADGRRFTPHVTLARLRNVPVERVMDYLSTHALFRSAPFLVSAFTLFSSHQGRGGAHYVPEAEYPLSPLRQ